jgi:anti-sigma regulatory factor (Ser/Thr protein kinase)
MAQALWVREAHLDPEPRSAALAREFVGHELRRHDLRYLVLDVQLVVSELVTNAVRHARTMIDVTLEGQPFSVLLVVHDRFPATPVTRMPGLTETGGRGLLIVREVSLDWGVDLHPQGGKSVWVMFGLLPQAFEDWTGG